MLSNVRIVNETGWGKDTYVFVGGTEMKRVSSVTIDRIRPGGLVRATIVVNCPEIDINSEVFFDPSKNLRIR